MNKREHILNAVLLGVGLSFVLTPIGEANTRQVVALTVPIILGALFPDIDTDIGSHRKTFHNLPVLAAFVAFPIYFGNLQYVWVGVLTHYLLDMMGSKRGIALFYPFKREFSLPFGVTVDSPHATFVTLLITALELSTVALYTLYL